MRMSRRDILTAASLAVSAAALTSFPAAAQEHGAEGGAEASEAEVARSVELGGIVFPVFDEKRKLKNYLFINIRDAIVRASHKVSFHQKDNIKKLDEKLAAAECLKAANAIVGEKDALVTMTFTQIASRT